MTIKASHNFKISHVRCFVEAANARSFSKAAEVLGISQSALSRAIRDLEQALGYDLFARSRSGVILLQAGELMLPHANRLLEAHEATRRFVAARRSGSGAAFKLSVDASVAPVIMTALTSNSHRLPEASVLQMAAMGSEEAVFEVLSHRSLLGLCGSMEGHPGINYLPLLQAPMGLLVPPGCAVPESLASLLDLDGVPMIRLADCTPVTRGIVNARLEFPAYLESPVVFTCLSAAFDVMREQKIAAVASGIGASLPQVRDMRFIPLPSLLPSITLYLISSQKLVHNEHAATFRQVVADSVAQSPWHASVSLLGASRSPPPAD